jgi:hypothetical protein
VGNSAVSVEAQGAPLPPEMRSEAARHRWQILREPGEGARSMGSPASMRKPFHISILQHMSGTGG